MFAAPFDVERLELTGPGLPLLDNVLLAQLSDDGTLLYTEGLVGGQARVELVTRDGVGTPIDSTWKGNFVHVSLSPDGRRVALDEADGNRQTILIREIEGGTISRLTFDDQTNMRPVWHPDGSRVAWVAPRDSTSLLYVKRADGVGQSSQLIADTQVWEAEWSRDGAWIVYRKYGTDDADDLYAVRTQGDTTPVPVSVSRFYERGAAISPDGRYVAYVSNESNRDEIYVRPFPNSEANRWIVSAGGGTEPRWSPTGTELFYVSEDNVLMSVPVTLGDQFTHQAPRALFSVRSYAREGNGRAYDVMPDGKQFVMLRGSPAEFGALVLVENWVAELRRKLGR
jgi:Tol biopolymer transport system component